MSKLPETYTGPGLLDAQVNGTAGFNFNVEPAQWTADTLHELRSVFLHLGISVIIPTFVTGDPEQMIVRARRYAELLAADAELAGFIPRLHIEGPFISPQDGPRGAHPEAYCIEPADFPDLIARLREASGERIGIVTLAPELRGAIDLIRRCSEAGICVAIGHSQTSTRELREAVDAGARMSTHLGNGSHQQLPRLDNYIQAQLAEDRLTASFIADGHHMPLTTLKNFLRAKTLANSVLVSDAMEAATLGPGEYEFGGRTAIVRQDGRVFRRGEDNLAGSSATLDACVVNACLHCDVTFEEAWTMASITPARLLGLDVPEEITVRVTREGFEMDRG